MGGCGRTVSRDPLPILRSTWRPPWWRRLAPLLCLWPALAAAQPAGPPTARQSRQIYIAANEHWLWLAEVTESGSRLFFRGAGNAFDLGRTTKLRIATMTALDRDLLVFFDDAAVYRYAPDTDARPTAESVLPQNQLPLDVVSEERWAYAIVASAAACELPAAAVDDATPTSQPFDPGDAPLSLVKYDGRTWSAVAPLPPFVQRTADARLRPRLYVVRGELMLFAPVEPPGQILHFYFNAESNRWIARDEGGVPDLPVSGLAAFWVVSFRNELTLVAASPGQAGRETIRALHLPGDPTQAATTTWSRADLEFSELGAGIVLTRYTAAVGFNQHLGLLAIDTKDDAYLRFALIGTPPVEPTLPARDVLARPGMIRHAQRFVQMSTFILLLVVLTGLFVFRRGSILKLVELPPGCNLALNVQRMLGWLIDFAPFTLAGAILLDVPWSDGLRTLAKWGITPDPEGGVPDRKVLLWWGFSVVCYTSYTLVMELIAARTVGKVLARVYLLSEAGTRPAGWQIVIRNLTRLIEFMPQFWFFVVLVLISRNRQRMGDIFARTLAIRLTPAQPAITDRKAAGSRSPQPSEPARGEAPAQPGSDESESPGPEASDTENESSGPGADQTRPPEPRDE